MDLLLAGSPCSWTEGSSLRPGVGNLSSFVSMESFLRMAALPGPSGRGLALWVELRCVGGAKSCGWS